MLNSSNLCDCAANKFFNTSTNVCETCNYKCATCTTSDPENCLTCALGSHRTFSDNKCPCDNYKWDSGSSICSSCHHSCLTCSSSASTGCLTCNVGAKRTIYNNNQCICMTSFYDNGQIELCQPCKYSCLTCTNANACTSCDVTLLRVLDTAVDPDGCPCK